MNFHIFIRNNDHPLKGRLCLKALSAFFKSPRMRPFTDAIARSAPDKLRKQCYGKVQAFADAFMTFLETPEAQGFLKISEQIDKELGEKPEMAHLQGRSVEGYLEKTLFWKFSDQIDDVQQGFIKIGTALLKKEHLHGVKSLDKGRLCSFEEYCFATWAKARDARDVMSPTLYQWYGYMQYVKSIIKPFAKHPFNTEHKRQALSLLEKISRFCGQVNKSTKTLHELEKKHSKLEHQIKDAIQKKFYIQSQYLEAYGLLPKDDPDCPADVQKQIAIFKGFHMLLVRERIKTRESILKLSAEFTKDGVLDTDCDIVKRCQPELNYWATNLPRFLARVEDIQSLHAFSFTREKGYDVIYRYISTGELDDLTKTKRFNQSPTRCLEREKWFFHEGGNPGDGVTHPVACKIYLKKGSLKQILSLAQPAGSYASVIVKDNEPCCFGVHEDGLWALNELVCKVEAKKTANNQKIGTIEFKGEPEDLSIDIEKSLSEPTSPPMTFLLGRLTESMRGLRVSPNDSSHKTNKRATYS